MAVRIYRCSDGHLFTVAWWKASAWARGYNVFVRCPVDHRRRRAIEVSPNSLSRSELDAAMRYRI
jgi:hypothetical protein